MRTRGGFANPHPAHVQFRVKYFMMISTKMLAVKTKREKKIISSNCYVYIRQVFCLTSRDISLNNKLTITKKLNKCKSQQTMLI